MRPPTESSAALELGRNLAEMLDVDPSEVRRDHPIGQGRRADAVLDLANHTFVIEWKGSSSLASIAGAVEQAKAHANQIGAGAIPVVGVPYMGPVGIEHCEQAGVGWMDLSGNARISAPGVRIRVEGRPNRFKGAGRPASAFAPKSSRIARWLLMHPHATATQKEIAEATGMGEGYTSRVVSRLEEDGLIVRNREGEIGVRDPDLLLDAWRQDYDFEKHRIVRAHAPARSGEELMSRIAAKFDDADVTYAMTGLAAAWLLHRFAAFRLVSLYVDPLPTAELLEDLGLRQVDQGENTWLIAPKDEGVFHGRRQVESIQCVHPVQAYLDLAAHPERAGEAAAALRHDLLSWNRDE